MCQAHTCAHHPDKLEGWQHCQILLRARLSLFLSLSHPYTYFLSKISKKLWRGLSLILQRKDSDLLTQSPQLFWIDFLAHFHFYAFNDLSLIKLVMCYGNYRILLKDYFTEKDENWKKVTIWWTVLSLIVSQSKQWPLTTRKPWAWHIFPPGKTHTHCLMKETSRVYMDFCTSLFHLSMHSSSISV